MKNKSIAQIKRKIELFKTKLSKKKVRENFGDVEIQLVQKFIGDVYDYPYEMRLEIQAMTNEFFNWCYNFTGK